MTYDDWKLATPPEYEEPEEEPEPEEEDLREQLRNDPTLECPVCEYGFDTSGPGPSGPFEKCDFCGR